MHRRILAAAAALLLADLVSGLDRIETVQKFRDARQRGDLAAARALMAPDARIWFDMEERTGPGAPWTLEPDDWDRWDAYFHSATTYSDWKDHEDRVTATGRETNDFYRLTEWKPKPLAFTWWLDSQGKITGFMFHAIKDAKEESRFGELEAWAKKTHPEELAYLTSPKGRINPAGDRPERWKKLAIEWRRAVGLPVISSEPSTEDSPRH
jgi:hypothetical protein